jgi:branched-chain amino acid transport system permease protein
MSFAVIVIGGLGSIPGAMLGAILIGVARAIAVHGFPELEIFVIYLLMSISLLVRPQGIFAIATPRKI